MADSYNFTGGGGYDPSDIGVVGRTVPVFNQAKAMQRSVQQMQLENMRWNLHERVSKMQDITHQKEGMAVLGGILAGGSFDDPRTLQAALGVAAKYGIDPQVLDPVMRRFQSSLEYKQKAELIDREYNLRFKLAETESQGRMDVERVRAERVGDDKTALRKNLEWADELDRNAKTLEDAGYPEAAALLRRNAGLARSSAEGGPSSYEGSLLRERDDLEQTIADYKSKMAQGKTFEIKGGYPLFYTNELGGLQARLESVNRRLSTIRPQEPQPAPDATDPLNLFK